MNLSESNTWKIATKIVARAIGGPRAITQAVVVGTISTIENLWFLFTSGVIEDLCRVKEALITKLEADTELAKARAKKECAEAVAAANKNTHRKRPQAIQSIETQLEQVQATTNSEEVTAIRREVKTNREKAIVEARVRLENAIYELRRNGGTVYIDSDDFKRFIERLNLYEEGS